MVSTRSRGPAPSTTTSEPPTKRIKVSASPSPPPPLAPPSIIKPGTTTSSNSTSSSKRKVPAKVATPIKRTVTNKFQEEEETPDAIELRKRNIGKRFSPGDGQFDYTLTEPEPYRDPISLEFIFPDYPRFKPNLSPQEILQRGAFDGGYFRPVESKKTGRELHEDWSDIPFDEWLKGLDTSMYLTRPEGEFTDSVNHWKPFVGQPYNEWEKNGWIREEHDARGWFQWYCRFWRGRRCEDDERQIGRWDRVAGEASGRWRRILLEKYRKAGISFVEPKEEEVSPGIRQTLNHWAFDPTTEALNRFREEKGDLVADEDADQDSE
ncbi:uncharacterized protein JCM6883_004981 [Sporobolomyces salmoneus]|uniref:uncharacterized protein n=1 Tax=Sporobolomyces salmoneus TaxID=183962 RepID=UPI003177765C